MSFAVLALTVPWLPRASREDRCVILLLTVASRPVLTAFTLPRQFVVSWFEELYEDISVERQHWRDAVAALDFLAAGECRLGVVLLDQDSMGILSVPRVLAQPGCFFAPLARP